jgi:hypothetical protein
LQGNGVNDAWAAAATAAPLADAPSRRELEELHRVEEVLVAAAAAAGQPVHRSPSAQPAAVLGVRMADKVSRAA